MTRRTRLLTAVAAVAATAAAVLVAGPGYHTSQVRMRSGTVWLASGQTGEVTLVDGASAEVKAHVPVAPAGTAVTVAQRGSAAVVLDRRTGRLSTVDSATEQVSPPAFALPPSDGLVVLSAPDTLYAVDVHSGLLAAVDPATLTPRSEPQQLARAIRPGSVAVDGHGRVWAIEDTTGDLVWLSGGQRRSRPAATRNGRLAIAAGRPVLVDPSRGTAELLDPETGATTRSVQLARQDQAAVVGGSAERTRVLVATGQGELISCSFDTGSCAEPVPVASPGADLGTPVEVGDHAVVPDRSTGQVTIVGLTDSRVVTRRQLFEQPAPFELIVHDGIVFFNDPNGIRAGVLDLSGEYSTITKYDGKATTGDVLADADHRARNEAAKTGHQPGKPGLPQAGDARATNVGPTAGAAASILVEPGRRGEVGDEFELTLALRPAGSAATARWTFGDGTEATGTTVRHRWSAPGTFTVRAAATPGQAAETTIVVDPAGAPPQITQLAVRRPKPVVGESVHFSADGSRGLDRWEWTVTRAGEPAPEVTAQTPEFDHAFSTPGSYTVALTVTKGPLVAQSSRQFTVARGAVKLWGYDYDGDLAVPSSAESGVIAIDAGTSHALALKSDGSVIAWGAKGNPALNVPPEALSGVVAIAAAYRHSVALKADGSVIAWGDPLYEATDVPEEAKHDVIAIAAGYLHNLALKKDGSVVAWGSLWAPSPKAPTPDLTDATAVAVGLGHNMALRADGSVVVWGDLTRFRCAPDSSMRNVRAIAAGWGTCVTLSMDGSVDASGADLHGELAVPAAAKSGVVAIDAAIMHNLALKADGSVVGWGDNRNGQSAVPPQYNTGVLAIAAGTGFSMVLVE
jgi:hypothetical protein